MQIKLRLHRGRRLWPLCSWTDILFLTSEPGLKMNKTEPSLFLRFLWDKKKKKEFLQISHKGLSCGLWMRLPYSISAVLEQTLPSDSTSLGVLWVLTLTHTWDVAPQYSGSTELARPQLATLTWPTEAHACLLNNRHPFQCSQNLLQDSLSCGLHCWHVLTDN